MKMETAHPSEIKFPLTPADYSDDDDDDVTENTDEYQPCDGDPSEHPTTTAKP